MKNLFKYDDIKREIFIFSVSGIIVVSFFYVINNIPVIQELLTKIIGILMPFIWAIAIAFLLSSTCKKIERSIPEKLSFKTRRSIAVLLSLILMIAVISIFLLVLVPQIVTSATQLASSMSTYIKEASKFFGDLAIKYGITQDTVSYILSYSQEIMNTVITFMQQNIPQIVGMTYSTITSIGSIVIGVIIASYMLLDKERLFGQFNKLARAFLKDEVTYFIKDVIFISIDKFNNFIVGKLIDSLIIGLKVTEEYVSNLTIRKFWRYIKRINKHEEYEACRSGQMSGMVTFKEPIQHWMTSIEVTDKYENLKTDEEELRSKIE